MPSSSPARLYRRDPRRANHTRRRWLPGVAALICTLALLPGLSAAAQPLQSVFDKANEAYLVGDLESAARGYEQLLQAGIDDADVHYNLALCYNAMGRRAKALVALERAIRARPDDDEARRGLARVRKDLAESQADHRGEAQFRTKPPLGEALFGRLTADQLAWLTLILNGLVFGALIARRRQRRDPLRLAMALGAVFVALLLTATLFGLVFRVGALRDGNVAIVLEDATLREGPDPRARGRGEAREGQRARTVDRASGFARVELEDGRSGWLPEAQIEGLALKPPRSEP